MNEKKKNKKTKIADRLQNCYFFYSLSGVNCSPKSDQDCGLNVEMGINFKGVEDYRSV
jgi:hypothetical protein